MAGRFEVIVGSMFSGKSEELMRRLRRLEISGKKVLLLRPDIDQRYSKKYCVSHNGTKMISTYTEPFFENIIKESKFFEVVGVDEIQFFKKVEKWDEETMIDFFIEKNKILIASGLDMDFRGEPFGGVPILMALADSVTKLNAVCNKCGQDAVLTQRLVDGEPASFSGPIVEIGGKESYEARCRGCFESKP